jgi:hypothetical protein
MINLLLNINFAKKNKMQRLKKTRELLIERQKQNRESNYGTPIPDVVWNEVAEELDQAEKDLFQYKIALGLITACLISIYLYIRLN